MIEDLQRAVLESAFPGDQVEMLGSDDKMMWFRHNNLPKIIYINTVMPDHVFWSLFHGTDFMRHGLTYYNPMLPDK